MTTYKVFVYFYFQFTNAMGFFIIKNCDQIVIILLSRIPVHRVLQKKPCKSGPVPYSRLLINLIKSFQIICIVHALVKYNAVISDGIYIIIIIIIYKNLLN